MVVTERASGVSSETPRTLHSLRKSFHGRPTRPTALRSCHGQGLAVPAEPESETELHQVREEYGHGEEPVPEPDDETLPRTRTVNCGDIERTLLGIQKERSGEHLPMERILEALHEDEYGEQLFLRDHGEVEAPAAASRFNHYQYRWR